MTTKLRNILIQKVGAGIFILLCILFDLSYPALFTEELETKIKALADFVRNSKHFIVYTGAGRYSSLFSKNKYSASQATSQVYQHQPVSMIFEVLQAFGLLKQGAFLHHHRLFSIQNQH